RRRLQMSAYAGWDHVGADASYRDVASRAIANIHLQRPSPFYGYLRAGYHQKVYLFPALNDARAWYDQRELLEAGDDYAAVFAVGDLRTSIMEDFGRVVTSGETDVGNWFWPLALGIPLGALGGYYYGKWREGHPGKTFPWISGESGAGVGAYPWA